MKRALSSAELAQTEVLSIPTHLWKKVKDVSLHRKLFLSIAKNFGIKEIDERHITEGSVSSVKQHVEGFWTEFYMPKRYSPSHKYSKHVSKENYFQEYKKIELVLSQYNNSLALALSTLFPEITWKPWRFHKETTLGNNNKEYEWWKFHSSVLAFFIDFISHISPSLSPSMITASIQSGRNPLQSIEAWYEISREQILDYGGKEMLEYHGSVYDAILFAFKDANNENWTREVKPWKFKYNIGYWESMDNRKHFFEYLKERLGVKEMEDWYSVGVEEIKEHGGAYLLYHYYKGSPMGAITDIFPLYDWKIWKFKHVPKYFWYNEENVRKVLDSISKELNIKDLDEWYHVKNSDLINLGCSSLLEKYGGIINMLSKYYPHHPWNFHYKHPPSQSSKSQLFIYHFISNLFPPELKLDIHIDYLHPELSYSNSKRPIELDVYIPALHLAFEYQGSQHYQNYYLFGDPQKSLNQRDAEKREICQKNGITLIEIPYWIDSPKSIVHLIHRNRPDISSKYFSQYMNK